MKIIIHREQFDRLQESLSPKDLKNRFNYMFNLDKNKHPGASSYELYKLIQTFQKYVNAIYRITKRKLSLMVSMGLMLQLFGKNLGDIL